MWAFIFFLIVNALLLFFGMSPLESELFAGNSKQRQSKSVTSTQPPLGSDSSSGPFSQVELGQQQQQLQQQQKDEKEGFSK
jgi:hypothetical protein